MQTARFTITTEDGSGVYDSEPIAMDTGLSVIPLERPVAIPAGLYFVSVEPLA